MATEQLFLQYRFGIELNMVAILYIIVIQRGSIIFIHI